MIVCGDGGIADDRHVLLDVWIPGKLVNPLNGSHGHWSTRARWAKTRREQAQTVYLAYICVTGRRAVPSAPKIVTFTARVWNEFDDDGLRAALKPHRDALKDMRLIQDDRPSAGHEFRYHQQIDRTRRGVAVRVEVRR